MPTYKIQVEDGDALKALNRIAGKLDALASNADKSFAKVGGGANASGVQIGAVSGVVQELTSRFIQMGERAASAFAQAVAGGVKLNEQSENIKIALTSIFEGNEAAADAFLNTIDKAAIRLGVSRQELRALGKSILPDVGSIDKTIQLLEKAVILGRDAGVGTESVRIALEEALASGGEGAGLISLQRRLNIPPDVIRRIREASKEIGIADALIQELEGRVEKSGLGIENFADSFTVLKASLASEFTDIQKLLGEATFEGSKDQLSEALGLFDEHRDEIERVAKAFGDLAARVVEIVGGGLADLITTDNLTGLETLADDFTRLVNSADSLAQILFGEDLLGSLITAADATIKEIGAIIDFVGREAAENKARIARDKAELAVLLEKETDTGKKLAELLGDPIAIPLARGNVDEETRLRATAAAQAAYNKTIEENSIAFKALAAEQAEVTQNAKDRTKVVEEETAAGKAAGDATLAQKEALEALTEAEVKAAEARATIGEKVDEARIDAARRLTDIIIKQSRKQLDAEIANSQKREDIYRQNADKIEDIFRKQGQKIEDAARDLSRDEADIIRKATRERQDSERQKVNRLIDIERDYRQELRRIQNQFNQSAEEAERNNDAQAFIAAIRTRDSQVDEAKASRQDDIDSAKVDAERRREELKASLDAEIEDAQLANARKLEDLQLSLERELEEQSIANDRAIEQQTIAEQRAAEQRALNNQQELDDFRTHQAQKLADLKSSLEAEYQAVVEYETKKADYIVNKAIEVQNKLQGLFNPAGAAKRKAASTPGQQTGSGVSAGTRRQSRQFGGPVTAGQQYLVGEAGPELFSPDRGGMIIPMPQSTMGSTTVNNRQHNSTFNLAESMFSDPVARQHLRNFVLGVIVEAG